MTHLSKVDASADKKFDIEHCFKIICVLVKYHGISIKVNTLKRRHSQFRLQGRTQVHSEYTLQEMMQHQFQTFFWIS